MRALQSTTEHKLTTTQRMEYILYGHTELNGWRCMQTKRNETKRNAWHRPLLKAHRRSRMEESLKRGKIDGIHTIEECAERTGERERANEQLTDEQQQQQPWKRDAKMRGEKAHGEKENAGDT